MNKLTTGLALAIVLGALLLAPFPSQAQGEEAVLYVTVGTQEQVSQIVESGIDVWHVDLINGQYVVTVWAEPTDSRLVGLPVTLDEERTQIYRDAPNQVGVTGVDGLGFMGGYLTASEMYARLDALAAANPTLAQSYDCGDSWDKSSPGGPVGYDIRCLHVGGTNNFDVVVISGEHARELMGPEIARLWAEWLLGGEADAAYLRFFDHRIMAIVNPDGHRMVETTGQTWRKNTHEGCSNANLRGVDNGRNYASVTYGGPGSSTDPCNETYRGTSAASEPETQAVQGVLSSQFTPLARSNPLTDPAPPATPDVFATIHTFSRLVYMPWSTNQQTPNHGQIRNICDLLGGKSGYTCKFPFDYPASGTIEDHSYDEYGVASVGFEVGTDFFEAYGNLPTRWGEMRPALIYLSKLAPAPYQLQLGPQPVTIGLTPAMVNTDTTVTVNASVSDSANGGQAISQAQLFVTTPPEFGGTAIAMSAVDGSFNQVTEYVTGSFSTAGLAAGRHLIMVQARDAGGNWGIVSAVWLTRINGPIHTEHLPLIFKNSP